MGNRTLAAAVILGSLGASGTAAHAGEAEIISAIRDFFAADSVERRTALAEQIAANPAFQREKTSAWLHRAARFEPRSPGADQLSVLVRDSVKRSVALRIPEGYDPARPWPVIYALHGATGTGAQIIHYVEHILGPVVEEYVVAAPTGYDEMIVGGEWSHILEHETILAALRRLVHMDNDRVYITGYSRGGHAAWTLAVLHADEFAGAIPIAGNFILAEWEELWPSFLPNLANLPVLCVWGEEDAYASDGSPSPQGGIAGINRSFCGPAEEQKLPLVCVEQPGRGHGDVTPPADLLRELLSRKREHYPRTVGHTFRHLGQAHAYWIEGHAWRGGQWGEEPPRVHIQLGPGVHDRDEPRRALASAYRGSFAQLGGTIEGQTISVTRRKITELTIWIGDDTIDWNEPVTVKVSGRPVFEARLEPDLCVCLTQAVRTYDFDRLRWAGLRFKSGGRTKPVASETAFP